MAGNPSQARITIPGPSVTTPRLRDRPELYTVIVFAALACIGIAAWIAAAVSHPFAIHTYAGPGTIPWPVALAPGALGGCIAGYFVKLWLWRIEAKQPYLAREIEIQGTGLPLEKVMSDTTSTGQYWLVEVKTDDRYASFRVAATDVAGIPDRSDRVTFGLVQSKLWRRDRRGCGRIACGGKVRFLLPSSPRTVI